MVGFWHWFIWQDTWMIVLGIVAVPILAGIAVYVLAMSGPVTRRVKPGEIAPPYMAAVTLLFALFAALMMGDIWHRETRIGNLVQEEAHSLRLMIDRAAICGAPCDGVRDAARLYARALAGDEWRYEWAEPTPDADIALARVLDVLVQLENDAAVAAPTRTAFGALYGELRQLRSERYGILYFDMAPHRWAMIIVLGVLTQLVLASVHVGRPAALIVVLGLFTVSFVVTLAYMALLVWPTADMSVVAPEDLRRLLDG